MYTLAHCTATYISNRDTSKGEFFILIIALSVGFKCPPKDIISASFFVQLVSCLTQTAAVDRQVGEISWVKVPNLVVETDLFARSIIVIVQRNNNKKKERKKIGKKKRKMLKMTWWSKAMTFTATSTMCSTSTRQNYAFRERERQHYTLLGLRLYCI